MSEVSSENIKNKFEVLPVFVVMFSLGLKSSELFSSSMSNLFFFCTVCVFALSFLKLKDTKLKLALLIAGGIFSGLFYGSILIEKPVDLREYNYLENRRGKISGVFTGNYRLFESGAARLNLKNVTFVTDSKTINISRPVSCTVFGIDFLPEPEQQYTAFGTFSVAEDINILTFRTSKLQPTGRTNFFRTVPSSFRAWLFEGLEILEKRHSAIVRGFMLGDTSLISTEDRHLFRKTGVSHILAVSGQHVMILSFVIASMLYVFQVPPVSRTILVTIFLVFYALLTPGAPSVWRAVIMYLTVSVTYHLEAKANSIRPVAIAAFFLLLYEPELINSLAFILSFSAVIGIVILRVPIESYLLKLFPKFLSRYLAVAFAANFATLPLSSYIFGYLSLGGFFVGPFVLWLFAYILPFSFLVSFVSVFWSGFAIILASGLTVSLDLFLYLLQLGESIPGIYFEIPTPPGIFIAIMYSLMLYVAGKINQNQLLLVQKKPSQIKQKKYAPKPNESDSIKNVTVTNPDSTIKLKKNRTPVFFSDQNALNEADQILQNLNRPVIKKHTVSISKMPLSRLSVEEQNLLNLVTTYTAGSLYQQNKRQLQAYSYCLGFVSNDVLKVLSEYFNPPLEPDEIQIDLKVTNRHLASSTILHGIISSKILTRAVTPKFIVLISRLQALFNLADEHIDKILKHQIDCSNEFISLRDDIIAWWKEFAAYDSEQQEKKN